MVGATAFTIDEKLARAASPFLARAGTKTIRLTTVFVPDTFQLYVDWIYARKIDAPQQSQLPTDKNALSRYLEGHLNLLIRAYLLGYELEDLLFQDALIDVMVMIRITNRLSPVSMTKFVFENTPRDSPLRKLFADLNVDDKDHYFITKNLQFYNDEALRDIGLASLRLGNENIREVALTSRSDPCVYHHHTIRRTGPCYRKRFGN